MKPSLDYPRLRTSLAVLALGLLPLLATPPPFPGDSDSDSGSGFRLHVLHTNDIHARFETFNNRELACKTEGDWRRRCYGGVVRRAGFVNDFRRKHENVLLLDAGDQFQGTPWFYTYKGVEASHFLNLLKYDAMALGNHEFDNGVQGLVPFLENVTVPVLCSNLVKDQYVPAKMNGSVLGHVVVDRQGRRIGIIGYITEHVPHLSKTGNLSFLEEKAVIARESKALRESGVDIIIALGHSGLKKDKQMASELEDIDLFVGGHSHSLLYSGTNPLGDEAQGEYPIAFNHSEGRVTLVVQAGAFGKYVGLLSMTFDAEGRLTDWSGNPVLLDDGVPEDPDIKEEMRLLNVKVDEKFNFVVGHSKVNLDASDNVCRVKECNIGNLIADSMVHYMRSIVSWTHLTVAFINGGSIRSSLAKGDITYGDVLTIWPFVENMVIVRLNGSTLLEVFEHSVSGFDRQERKGKFLQVSGLIVTYDLSEPDGKKVVEIRVRDCFECDGYERLEPGRTYDVATQSYLLDGGDGYSVLKKFKDAVEPIDSPSTEALVRYLEQFSPVDPRVEGRILFQGETPDKAETKDPVSSAGLREAQLAVLLAPLLASVASSLSRDRSMI